MKLTNKILFFSFFAITIIFNSAFSMGDDDVWNEKKWNDKISKLNLKIERGFLYKDGSFKNLKHCNITCFAENHACDTNWIIRYDTLELLRKLVKKNLALDVATQAAIYNFNHIDEKDTNKETNFLANLLFCDLFKKSKGYEEALMCLENKINHNHVDFHDNALHLLTNLIGNIKRIRDQNIKNKIISHAKEALQNQNNTYYKNWHIYRTTLSLLTKLIKNINLLEEEVQNIVICHTKEIIENANTYCKDKCYKIEILKLSQVVLENLKINTKITLQLDLTQ